MENRDGDGVMENQSIGYPCHQQVFREDQEALSHYLQTASTFVLPMACVQKKEGEKQ